MTVMLNKARATFQIFQDLRSPPLVSRAESVKRERLKSMFSVPKTDPVIIFGMQKSGTSAICALLGEATGKRAQVDFRGAWEPYLTDLTRGRTPISEFVKRNAWAFSASIVKEPCLTPIAPELVRHLPASKAVFVFRDPAANIQSILNRLEISGQEDNLSSDDPRIFNETWRSVLFGLDLGLQNADHITALAKRWRDSAINYLNDKERYVLVKYEDFLTQKSETIANLALSVGLQPVHAIDHLVDKQYQPAARKRLSREEFFSPKNLSIIDEICSDTARELGYSDALKLELLPTAAAPPKGKK